MIGRDIERLWDSVKNNMTGKRKKAHSTLQVSNQEKFMNISLLCLITDKIEQYMNNKCTNTNTIKSNEEFQHLKQFVRAVTDNFHYLNYQAWWKMARNAMKTAGPEIKNHIVNWNEELIKSMQVNARLYKNIKNRSKINITNILEKTSIKEMQYRISDKNQKEVTEKLLNEDEYARKATKYKRGKKMKNNTLRCQYTNMRGLFSKRWAVEAKLRQDEPDFFFMTETKLKVKSAQIENYEIINHFRKNSKITGGGLGFYVKK